MSDDGVRLFIDSVKQIDGWSDHPATSYQYTMQHDGGSLNLVLEYYEHEEAAQVKLSWVAATPQPSPTPQPTPTVSVVVDDQDSTFERGGLTTTWQEEDEGHADHLFWTNNNDKTRTGYKLGQMVSRFGGGQLRGIRLHPREQCDDEQRPLLESRTRAALR